MRVAVAAGVMLVPADQAARAAAAQVAGTKIPTPNLQLPIRVVAAGVGRITVGTNKVIAVAVAVRVLSL